ncbi:LexA/Signal peptidase [Fistulina hepatica ATCC 64428]|uniref:Mitochondrial inner membrane protease subunit 2 n=1 Tax=Fistulina hepatica ATCC 64428 TaxID=1128425 RepID=A0A0D7A739_9AGAR|nr:LexA/Signal peptidase [Fistulina hepatica ATCC 64428]
MPALFRGYKRLWKFARNALFWSPTAFFVSELYSVKQVAGRSMQPTLNPDDSELSQDVGLFNRWAVHLPDGLSRGDIILLKHPNYPGCILIKRIIALPDDTVETLEPYPVPKVRLPPAHVWVEGDEPWQSDDSNHYGPVSIGLIDAKLVCLLWPWWRMGGLARLDRDWRTGEVSQRAKDRAAWRRRRIIEPDPSSG